MRSSPLGDEVERRRASEPGRRIRRWALSAVLLAAVLVGRAVAAEAPIDLNTASVGELTSLPGIGDAKAKAIIAYREATPFRSVDDLRQVKGIGDHLLDQLRGHVTVSSPSGGAHERGESAAHAKPAAAASGSGGTTGGAASKSAGS